jgi:uncharacterized protein YegP (UPF0339 family)
MQISMCYSRDDGGWYAEVFVAATGATVFTTKVYTSKELARREAREFIDSRRTD